MKKRYWYCPTDTMGQRTGEWCAVELTEEEARAFPHYLYDNQAMAMRAALS